MLWTGRHHLGTPRRLTSESASRALAIAATLLIYVALAAQWSSGLAAASRLPGSTRGERDAPAGAGDDDLDFHAAHGDG
jgi:hypothetical protein